MFKIKIYICTCINYSIIENKNENSMKKTKNKKFLKLIHKN